MDSDKIKQLYGLIHKIYTQRGDSHPNVAAQFHVDAFVNQNKTDKYFSDLLDMELADCARALTKEEIQS